MPAQSLALRWHDNHSRKEPIIYLCRIGIICRIGSTAYLSFRITISIPIFLERHFPSTKFLEKCILLHFIKEALNNTVDAASIDLGGGFV